MVEHPSPPQRLITIEEGPQLASRSDLVSFAQLGEQHAWEVESRGGEEPTDEEVDKVSVPGIPSTRGTVAVATAVREVLLLLHCCTYV